MGIFVAMETYVTFFGSMQFSANYIGEVQTMCVNFEKNRLKIYDFRLPFFINSTIEHR